VAVLLLAAAACTGSGDDRAGGEAAGGESFAGDPVELRVLAGSELADMEPILAEAAEATGVTVRFEFVGTLDGIQRVVDGDVGGYDAVWFSSNRYLALHPEAEEAIRRQQEIMTSPVVLGLAPAVARSLGWHRGAAPTWADIARAAAGGRFTYAMTNPAASNSGFSALVGVTAALSGTGAALEQRDVDEVAGQLRGFFSGQKLSAGSSGWLSDAYVARATGSSPGPAVDGLVNYESVLLSVNGEDRLPDPLTIVYPSDGVVTADYPLSLLASASGAARDGYERLTGHLLTPEVQRSIMETTHRRPAVPDVEPDESFGDATLVELPFPARLDVVNDLIGTYFDRLRRPVRTVYVLDVSGSMEGERIESLRAALVDLTGADDTLARQSRQFHEREEITLLPFSTTPGSPQSYVVPTTRSAADQARAGIRAAAEGLTIGGDTAVYDSLEVAYDELAAAGEGDFATSIVLMTDGETNTGAVFEDFARGHRSLPPSLREVPVFTILFGDGNVDEMERVAELTGGRSFDARADGLAAAFREIRDYQ
jgi:Ca-activated chloride channel homolog